MAVSMPKEEILQKGYVPFNYRAEKINGKNLVVAEHGQWVLLNDNEFGLLENGIVEKSSQLFSILEEKGIILTLKNEKAIEDFFRQRLDFLFKGVSLHIVVLTNRCTHKCVYCHASAKGSKTCEVDMSIETAKKTVDFIFQSPSHWIEIEFQGGEPLINFDVLKFIVKYAREKNMAAKKELRFSVITNLQLMDSEKLDFLMDEGISICTSLDGPQEVHNKNRIPEDKGFNSHENTIKWIGRIQKRCKEEKKDWSVSAVMTTTRNSLGKAREIVDEYANLGLRVIAIRPLNGLGFSRENLKDIGYSAKEFIEFWKKCMERIIELNKKGIFLGERMASVILAKILGTKDPGYLELRSPCGACIGQLAYNYNGDIYSCDDARTLREDVFRIGTVEQKYAEVLGCGKSCLIISSSILDNASCNECVWKPYCGTCPVITFSETNSLIPVMPQDAGCKIHYAQFEYIFEKIQDEEFQEIVKKWLLL